MCFASFSFATTDSPRIRFDNSGVRIICSHIIELRTQALCPDLHVLPRLTFKLVNRSRNAESNRWSFCVSNLHLCLQYDLASSFTTTQAFDPLVLSSIKREGLALQSGAKHAVSNVLWWFMASRFVCVNPKRHADQSPTDSQRYNQLKRRRMNLWKMSKLIQKTLDTAPKKSKKQCTWYHSTQSIHSKDLVNCEWTKWRFINCSASLC